MPKTAILSNKLAPPVGPFSTAVTCDGLMFLSGQVGQDPTTRQLVDGGVEAQTIQIFENVIAALEAGGRTLDDVLRVGVFLTDMSDFATMNNIYAQKFSAPYPARTTVGVAALPLGAVVEIDVIAR